MNAYNFQDVSRWKDLGPKFILQIYRNYYYVEEIYLNTYHNHIYDIDEVQPGSSSSNKLSSSSAASDAAGCGATLNVEENYYDRIPNLEKASMRTYLEEIYPILLTVMKSMEIFDKDQDGMIENSGFPDQTYDIWIAKGIHAYCGGLWIASCEAMSAIATLLAKENDAIYYSNLANRGRKVYLDALWNGIYLNYDNSDSSHHDSIMADMLAGQWYARACDLPPPITSGRAFSCLTTIYRYNVIEFGKGHFHGAVNGMRPDQTIAGASHSMSISSGNAAGDTEKDCEIDQCCIQSREVWTGTTYALSAAMLEEAYHSITTYLEEEFATSASVPADETGGGIESNHLTQFQRKELIQMAFNTAKGIHDAGWQKYGYWFATPEAWEQSGNYRSLGYMRALCIWSMQYAREQCNVKIQKKLKNMKK